MKFIRGIAVAVTLLVACAGIAQSASVDWVKRLEADAVPKTLNRAKLLRANDGSLYVIGSAENREGEQRAVVTCLSASGDRLWSRRLDGFALLPGNEDTDVATPAVAAIDGGLIVLVQSVWSGSGSEPQFLIKLSASGSEVWRRQAYGDRGNQLTQSATGEIYVATYGGATKWSANGDQLWTKSLPIERYDGSKNALVNAQGDLVVAAGTRGSYIYKRLDGALEILAPSSARREAIVVEGNRLITIENVQIIPSTQTVVYTIRSRNFQAQTQWTTNFAVPTSATANPKFFLGPNGGVYVTHVRDLQPYGDVALIDGSGAIQWNRNYFRVYGFVQRNGLVHGLRYDANSSQGVNGFFPIEPSNGDLGTPGFTTTSNPPHRLDAWIATTNGFAAVSNTGVAQRVLEVAPTGAFLWGQESARVAEETAVDRTSCLMPRIALSSPARVSSFAQVGSVSNGQNRLDATSGDGGSVQSTVADTGHCATSLDGAGGTYRVVQNTVRRVNESGTTIWSAQTSSSEINRVSLAASSGGVLVAGDQKVRRLTSSGTVLWEVAYDQPGSPGRLSDPKYLSEDADGNVIVAGDGATDYWAMRVSATGTVIYRELLGSPACSDLDPRFHATSLGELYVLVTTCNEGRIYKYAANGSLLWQRAVSPELPDRTVRFADVAVSSSGDVYVGGCVSSGYIRLFGERVVLQSYTSSGSERWNRVIDVLPDAKECVIAMAVESSKLIVAVESDRSNRGNYLVALNAANGTEILRSADVLSNPAVVPSDIRAAESGRVFVLGDSDPSRHLVQVASLRKIDLSSVPTTKAAFLSLPNPPVTFRTAFAVTLGLQTTAGATYTAMQPTQIWLSRGAGTGALSGPSSCTVATGQSSCSINGLVYDRAETGVSLVAEVDGSLPTTSPLFDVARAPTQTTMEVLTAPPYYAFDRIQVRYSVAGVAPMQSNEGYINRSPYTQSCVTLPQLAGFVLREECTVRIRVGEQLTANFYSSSGYAESAATPIGLSISPVPLALQASSVPSPRAVVGTEFLLTAKLVGARGEDMSGEYDIYVDVRDSNGNTVCGLYPSGRPIRYCGTFANVTGTRNYAITVQSSPNIIAPSPVNVSVEVIAGLALSGALLPSGNTNPKFCATAANADCDVSVELNRYFCALPIGWTGSIYPQVDDLTARATPNVISISGEAGSIVRDVYFNSGAACSFDTDANGAIETFSDGLFVLRAMLRMPAAANETLPAGACARRTTSDRTSFVGSQIASLKYDIDGNGSVSAATDGVLLMRALLGLRGDAVTTGALGVGATRQNWNAVRDYLAGTCGVGALY